MNMEERKPLLSDPQVCDNGHPPLMSADQARDFYEDMITRGELLTKEEHERLVKQAILDHESNQRGSW